MGRYVTTTSIPVLMPGFLVGNTPTSDTAGVDLFSSAADFAEGWVNSVLVNRWDPSAWTTTGNPGIPPSVRMIAANIAIYESLRRSGVQDAQIQNRHLLSYENAVQALNDLKEKRIGLAYTDGSLVPTRSAQAYLSSTEGYTPIFGLDDPEDWKRDTDEIDDQSDARE